jgi:hypothetical protein
MGGKNSNITLKTSSYFPKTVRAIGALFCIFGLAMIWTLPVIGLLFLFITAVTFTTHYGFEISLAPNSFREFVWVLGWKDGKKTSFNSVEFLFIQSGKFSFLTYTLKEKQLPAFEGYLKFEGRNEVHAITDVSRDKLVARLRPMADYLQIPILDYSEGVQKTVYSPKSKN